MVEESWATRLLAWWPVAGLVLVAVGFAGLFVQLGTEIQETRTLQTDVVAMHQRLVALEETTSQLRLDAVGAQMRNGAARVPRPRPIRPEGQAGAKAGKAKAGKAKAGKAKAKAEGGAKAKAEKAKGKAKRGKGKAKATPAP